MSREILPYRANQTPSTLTNHYLDEKRLKESVEDSFKPVTITDENALEEIQAVAEAIKDHCEMRLHIFLTQLMTCKGRGLKLSYVTARIQAGRENKKKSGSLVEAHSATLPHLLHRGNTWGEGTTFELMWNSTVTLPSLVNHLDIALDENNPDHQGSFRDRALDLLQQATKDKITIKAAFIEYMDQLKRGIELVLKKKAENPAQREALGYYLEIVEEYLETVSEDPASTIPRLLCCDQSIKKIQDVLQKRMEVEICCQINLTELKERFAVGRKHAKDGVICLLFESVVREKKEISNQATLKHIRAAVINSEIGGFIEEKKDLGKTDEEIRSALSGNLKKFGINARDSQTVARRCFTLIQSSQTNACEALERYFNRSFSYFAEVLKLNPTMSTLVANTLAKDTEIKRLCRSIVSQIETITSLG